MCCCGWAPAGWILTPLEIRRLGPFFMGLPMGDGHLNGSLRDQRSYRCIRCGRVYFLSHFNAEKVSGLPRCVFCGGTGEETAMSIARRGGGEPRKGKVSSDSKRFACAFCGQRFRSDFACQIHEEERHATPDSDGKAGGFSALD